MPPLRWRHVIVNTYGSWLPGDERGFRSRDHRIHSSGDYRNPPPSDEHAGLREHHRSTAPSMVRLTSPARRLVIRAFIEKLRELGFIVIVVSADAVHVHLLTQLPNDREQIRKLIGKCKQRASLAVRDIHPGRVWSARGEFRMIRDRAHHRNAFTYIRTRQGGDAVVWSIHPEDNWIDR